MLRDRLYLHDEIPDDALDGDEPPYYRPPEDSVEYQYMVERRNALAGSLPRRVVRTRRPLELPAETAFKEVLAGSGGQSASTTMAFTRLLRNLARDTAFGQRVVPIIPDEARTFGMDSLFREIKIYASHGQKYEPVDADLLLSYTESADGQILEEGITEAGALSSFIAAATSYATRGVPDGALLHLLLDVRLPAGGRPHLAGRRHPGPRASCSAPPPGAPRCSARACSTRTATAWSWPRPCRRARPTTRPSPTRWPRSSATASSACTARTRTTSSST